LGECYEFDLTSAEPMMWVTCQTGPTPQSANLVQPPGSAASPLPAAYIPGQPITVTINATPASSTIAYAVEDQLPQGWTASGISAPGQFDSVTHKVKWGPFYDSALRTLSYTAMPPMAATGLASFNGLVSFDGGTAAITGPRSLQYGARLSAAHQNVTGQFTFTLGGELGRTYMIETSTNLTSWLTIGTVTNFTGQGQFTDPSPAGKQKFYRIRTE
jgi:hypothetical protein